MKAMRLASISPLVPHSTPLEVVELPLPIPTTRQIRLAIHCCGVCHTELDELEGRSSPPQLPVTPGHQVVGTVDALGPEATRFSLGDRVGVGWIYSSSGGDKENTSPEFQATGRDVDGGYAEYMCVPETYAVAIPDTLSDQHAAPLLCAGAVGYRSLRLSGLVDGQLLGLMGFGASAHIVLQTAAYLFPKSKFFVFARDPESRKFAKELGADWCGAVDERCPEQLDAIIDTTPAWKPVRCALENLAPAGRLVINAIRKEDTDKGELQNICYEDHLWMEKEIKSVANVCMRDLEEFLPLAAKIPITPTYQTYALSEANQALLDLKFKSGRGAKVLQVRAED